MTVSVLTSSVVSANDIDHAALFRRGFGASTTSITIGGLQPNALIAEIAEAGSISCAARWMIGNGDFHTLVNPEKVHLISFFLRHGLARLGVEDLLDEKILAAWSEEHLNGYIIRPCPAEVGPHLALQSGGHPGRACLWVVAHPISVPTGTFVFGVKRSWWGDKPRLCEGSTGCHDFGGFWNEFHWPPNCRVVYQLIKTS